MSTYVLKLSDPQATLENVGGKGMSLAKMINTGFPVPDGFHVTTEAYRQFVTTNNLQAKIITALKDVDTTLPASLETASTAISRSFAESKIPNELATSIANAYAALPPLPTPSPSGRGARGEGKAVAVRSSATAEDLPEASFAGQQETFLNIRGEEALLDAVKKCWASLWTARAIAYRIKNNIDQNTVALAVVVQEMVDAEAAGILFTANPINGHRDEMVINAAWGLGEAIVGGLVSPDTIVADKTTGRVKTYDVAEKTVITVRTEKGTSEESLIDTRRSSKVMNDAQVIELVNIARRIESFYGKPQDIEWCRTDDHFYIVQSRPITTLKEIHPPTPTNWKLPKGAYAVMRNNIVELMADPLTPLFATLGLEAINTSLPRMMNESFGMRGIMPDDIIIVVNKYAYNNGSVSAKGMVRLLFNMGKIARMMFTGAVERWTEHGRPHYFETVKKWSAKDWRSFSSVELVKSARQLTETAIDAYVALVSGVIPAAWITEAVFTNVYNRLIKRRDDPTAPTYLLGFDSLPIRADKSLYSLAEWVRQNPALAQCLERTATSQLVALCESGQAPGDVTPSLWQDWRVRFHQHLREYGYMLYDLDFVHPVPADDPAPVLDALKLYLSEQGTNPYSRQRESAERRVHAVMMTRLRLKGLRSKWFNKYLASAQKYAPLREDGLAEIGLAYPLIRQMLREVGSRFVKYNVISNVDDIFWLTQDEVLQTATRLDAGQSVGSLAENIPYRKAEHQAALSVRPPMMLPQMKIFGFDLMSLRDKRGRRNRGDVIKGVAASPGAASGVARVLHGPEDFGQMKPGDVLVAPITTPAWTPLFAMASAVVTDIGGPLSHGSIVAREYGIPAVLGTGVATHNLQSGDLVEVNGTEGRVFIKARAALKGETTQWIPPSPKGMYMRGSLCEHLPNPVSPLFGTLGIRMVNIPTMELGEMALGIGGGGYQYRLINGYMYLGMELTWREWVSMAKNSAALTRTMFKTSHETWLEARKELIAAVALQDEKNVKTLSPSALLDGARELMIAIGRFYTVIQSSTLPAATGGEMMFTRVYNMVSRKDEPKAETLLFGLETTPLRAEKTLFDLGMWTRENPALRDFTLQASTEELVTALGTESTPEVIPAADWREFKSRFGTYLDEFGHTTYEFDFINPTPVETPEVILDALKLYIDGKGSDPYARQREADQRREETFKNIRSRFKLIPNRWFDRPANYATRLGPDREDSIADLGMGHTTVRRMLGELGKRLAVHGVIENAEDIYWLVEDEVNELASLLERNEILPDHSTRIPERKAEWHARMKLIPPVMFPEKSILAKMMPWNRANTTNNVLTGVASSAGKVTATARVLFGPEDFDKMKHGDVLVAVTTTPAWTPLFAMASAIVSDLGGPLSHSSIVAREYGIPAVVATGVGTRRIQDGQTITVDGTKGEVILEKSKEGQTEQPAPPLEWRRFNPKAVYARGSLAEHLPNAVSPLFGTLGLRAVNKATGELGDLMNIDVLEAEYQYRVVNGYVYMGFLLNLKFTLAMTRLAFSGLKFMFTGGRERWLEARRTLAGVIAKWDEKNHTTLSPFEILEGARELTYAAGKYYTLIQSGTLPSASSSEIIFTSVYKMVKRNDDPDAPTLLFGLETVPLRAEKSLFDLGIWIRERPALRDFTLQTPTVELVAALSADSYPETVPSQEWDEFKSRLDKHLDEFGHTSYEFDFMNPTPAETPGLIIEAVKAYVEGKGSDPYARQREVTEKREQTLKKIRSRFKLIPNRWFNKSFQWAIDTGPAREDSLADMGMGHTTIRRLLGELGKRFVANGALENPEDIYWLIEDEVENLSSLLERGEHLPNHVASVSERKGAWHQQMKLIPPAVIPQNSSWAKVFPWSKENVSGNVIKGLGASAGKVTATARLLFSPEDFNKMKQGDVLVAVTTTPAWTPLFALASAIVTDIGGPLSHSSIVAREYGIPAVVATGVGTRRIADGQTITVDGRAGTVELK